MGGQRTIFFSYLLMEGVISRPRSQTPLGFATLTASCVERVFVHYRRGAASG
jgi:hypothetical protein